MTGSTTSRPCLIGRPLLPFRGRLSIKLCVSSRLHSDFLGISGQEPYPACWQLELRCNTDSFSVFIDNGADILGETTLFESSASQLGVIYCFGLCIPFCI